MAESFGRISTVLGKDGIRKRSDSEFNCSTIAKKRFNDILRVYCNQCVDVSGLSYHPTPKMD